VAGHVWAYARVSTRDQNPQLQLDALAADGYDTLVMEKDSGKRGTARPESEDLLSKPAAGDTLVFWKSDRWGRSAGHVLTTVTELRERGVRVVSLTENFDLETKEGRFMFAVLAAAAEYELELRAERQADGIAAAKRREAEGNMLPGKQRIGSPRVLGPTELDLLRGLVDEGVSVTEAARRLKIGRSTAYAALAASQPLTRHRTYAGRQPVAPIRLTWLAALAQPTVLLGAMPSWRLSAWANAYSKYRQRQSGHSDAPRQRHRRRLWRDFPFRCSSRAAEKRKARGQRHSTGWMAGPGPNVGRRGAQSRRYG